MSLSLIKFRANLYKIIERKGVKIKLVPEKKKSKLTRLVKHSGTIKGDPESLVHMDWSSWFNQQ